MLSRLSSQSVSLYFNPKSCLSAKRSHKGKDQFLVFITKGTLILDLETGLGSL